MKKTKFAAGLGILIFFAFLIALFLISFLHLQSQPSLPNFSLSNQSSLNSSGGISSSIVLNNAEVSKHNTPNDCWMIINNKVYALTSLTYSHSGGSSTIIPYCGKDGSVAFNTKDGQGSHSSTASSILSSLYVGDLNQQIGVSELQNKTSNITNTTIPRSGEDDEYEDD